MASHSVGSTKMNPVASSSSGVPWEKVKAATAGECPHAPPGCHFEGIFIDEELNCWCVYSCGGGTLLIPCP